MQSHGGVAPLADAVRLAAGAILSGPAGGVAAGRYAARILGEDDLITLDMGGTSTDVGLIVNGTSPLAANRVVAGQPVALPSLEIAPLGIGGGSIATADRGGLLRSRTDERRRHTWPWSCYGRGGREPTLTDANLLLGYLDPANFLGGRVQLDVAAAKDAVDRLANRSGMDRIDLAEGIHRLADTQLASGLRLVSVRRGLDPRRFTLLAFGGAAGLHITDVARQVEVRRVVVPRAAAVLSAWGMLSTDLRYEMIRTHIGDVRALGDAVLRADVRRHRGRRTKTLWAALGTWVETRVERAVDMRYGEQVFEVTVPLDGLDPGEPGLIDRLVQRFHQRHEALYTL